MENEKEFLDKVEKAAKKGASKGVMGGNIIGKVLKCVFSLALVFGVIIYINAKMRSLFTIENLLGANADAYTHDLVLEDNGFVGYLAADFAEPVITKGNSQAKLVVYEVELHEITTLTESGLFNWSAFSKSQCLTYYATGQYTIELEGITVDDIEVDNEKQVVTIKVPGVVLDNIIIDNMEAGDTVNGILTFGEIKLTAQQSNDVEVKAKETMRTKLEADEYLEKAEKYGKLAVKDIYLPVIRSIDKRYTVEIEFK